MSTDPVLLSVDGMFCSSCALALERVLQRIPGVQKARVGFSSGVASLWLQTDAVAQEVQDKAMAASVSLGYPCQPWSPEPTTASAPLSVDASLRIAIGAFLGMWVMVAQLGLYTGHDLSHADEMLMARAAGVFATPIVFLVGSKQLVMGWRTLRAGIPGMDTLVAVGAIGAWSLSMVRLVQGRPEVWFDSASMLIVFLLVGRQIEVAVRQRGADAVRALLSTTSQRAVVLRDGTWQEVDAKEVIPGEHVRIDPHRDIPIDGRVLRGRSLIDGSVLTGESALQTVDVGDSVFAGMRNQDGTLDLVVEEAVGQRRIDGIASAVRVALAQRTESASLGERVARAWFPIVIVLAAVTAIAGSLLVSVDEGILRALSVLVVTCPCALSVASPLVTAVTLGRSAKLGILFRDGDALRRLADVQTLAFDKTGTLTAGTPEVVGVDVVGNTTAAELLDWARRAQQGASHPLASALRATGTSLEDDDPREQFAGLGVSWPAQSIRVGAPRWFGSLPLAPSENTEAWVERNGILLGRVRFDAPIRPDAAEVIRRLSASHPLVLWSGDAAQPVQRLAYSLGISESKNGVSPEDKAQLMEALQGPSGDAHPAAYVGDGINDAPVLAKASVGIAIGGATDAARASASVVLAGGGLQSVEHALDLARAAKTTTQRALLWAALYNGVALPAAMAGWIRPHWAVVAMLLSSVSVTVAAARVGRRVGHSSDR